jgi:hypothetical protein
MGRRHARSARLDGKRGALTGRWLHGALLACGVLVVAGGAGAVVRLLPWFFAVPVHVAVPFARGLVSLAFEVSLCVGWPVGWALATLGFVESGEARVLALLGERPLRTLLRLVPQALGFAVVVVLASFPWESRMPGRLVGELMARGRSGCAEVTIASSLPIPFTELAWVCAPGRTPRLVGKVPRGVFTARSARVADDLGWVELTEVRLQLSGEVPVRVGASRVRIGGISPWPTSLAPWVHAGISASSAIAAAFVSVLVVLRGGARGRAWALLVGASGPLAALGVLRGLERVEALSWMATAAAVLVCGAMAPLVVGWALGSLRAWGTAASTARRT